MEHAAVTVEGGARGTFAGGIGREPGGDAGLRAALEAAVAGDLLALHYQPILDLSRGTVVGAEALARWPQLAGGCIPPAQFIPLAEESGLIVDLGRWALEQASRALAGWDELMRWTPRVFVNVSPAQLADSGFVETVERVVAAHDFQPEALCLELTESAAILRDEVVAREVKALRSVGVRVGLDDFGTGFATHAALRSVEQVDFLKVDRQFVAGLPANPTAFAIVHAVVDLARSLGAEVIAEGVENEDQRSALASLGCDLAQGHYFSMPVPLERFEALASQRTVARRATKRSTPTDPQGAADTEVAPEASRGEILVVDDDATIRELVGLTLGRAGYTVMEARSGADARAALGARRADLVVLDLQLGDVHGFDLIADIRDTSSVPVIVLTAQGSEGDRVMGLQCGADDYMVKPFSPRELTARVAAVLRRASGRLPEPVRFAGFTLDLAARELLDGDNPVELTTKEFALLEFLAGTPGTAHSRDEILREVWSVEPHMQAASTVTEHVRRIRQKVERDPRHPRHLVTVHGVGYRFVP